MIRRTQDFEIAFFERLVKDNPDYVDALIPLAELYTKMKLYEKGLQIDKRLSRLRKNDPTVHYNLACSLALMNQSEEAIQALEKSIELGYNDFNHLKRDPDLKNLLEDPRVQRLISNKANP